MSTFKSNFPGIVLEMLDVFIPGADVMLTELNVHVAETPLVGIRLGCSRIDVPDGGNDNELQELLKCSVGLRNTVHSQAARARWTSSSRKGKNNSF